MRSDLQSAIAIIALIASILFAFTTVVCAGNTGSDKQRKATIAWSALFFACYIIMMVVVLRA